MISAPGVIAAHWKILTNNLGKMGSGELLANQNQINRMLGENGVTYNIYGTDKNTLRSWHG